MRKIIFVTLGFVFILGMLALLSLLLPSKITITKSVGVNVPSAEVHEYVNDLRKWPEWFLPMEDSSMNITYTDGDASVTIRDNKGKEMKLEKMPSTIDTVNFALRTPSATRVFYQVILIPQNEYNTQIVFNVNTYFKWYPWEKIKGVFLDKMSGPMYQKSMYQLEKAIEGDSF